MQMIQQYKLKILRDKSLFDLQSKKVGFQSLFRGILCYQPLEFDKEGYHIIASYEEMILHLD